MLVIRFQRTGRKNDPAFRMVVTEKRSKPQSGELEILGSFHPKTKETVLKNERILHWISKGAQTSPRVHNLLISKGVIRGKKIDVASRKNAGKAVPEETAPAGMLAQASAEETKAAPPMTEESQEGKMAETTGA